VVDGAFVLFTKVAELFAAVLNGNRIRGD
jgi:hypothetical protein